MTVLTHHPRVLIALACSLAQSKVFLDDNLPFYVRDESNSWAGYCNLDGNTQIIKCGTLGELQKLMENWYEELREERYNGTVQQEVEEHTKQADTCTDS